MGYSFKNPSLLLMAVTHPSAKSFFQIDKDYEKLEALGDAILDYIININMMRFTMFERYLPQHDQENLSEDQREFLKYYRASSDYNPCDAHQAKLKLAKNELLAKMSCVLGFHQYCLFYDQQDNLYSKKDVRDYLNYSFTSKNFPMNQRRIEPFETPKILGDIFESIIGAVYEDAGLDEVHRVFRHLLAPLITYNTQFSKLAELYGEPKEQMQWKCNELKIKPKYLIDEESQVLTVRSQKQLEHGRVEHVDALMFSCKVLFRNGRTMCRGIGSTKRQAERNAAVMGLLWIDQNIKELKSNVKTAKAKDSAQEVQTAVAFTKFDDADVEREAPGNKPAQKAESPIKMR